MKSKTDLSIIIPTYHIKHIEQCIKAIINQETSFNFDIHVVINFNNKNKHKQLATILNNYPQIKIHHCKKIGASRARNYGAKLVTGETIAFIDSDCQIETNWVDYLLKSINQGFHCASSSIIPKDINESFIHSYRLQKKNISSQGTGISGFNFFSNSVPHINSAAFMISKKSFSLLNGFNEKLKRMEDGDFSNKVYALGLSCFFTNNTKAIVYDESSLWSYLVKQLKDTYYGVKIIGVKTVFFSIIQNYKRPYYGSGKALSIIFETSKLLFLFLLMLKKKDKNNYSFLYSERIKIKKLNIHFKDQKFKTKIKFNEFAIELNKKFVLHINDLLDNISIVDLENIQKKNQGLYLTDENIFWKLINESVLIKE